MQIHVTLQNNTKKNGVSGKFSLGFESWSRKKIATKSEKKRYIRVKFPTITVVFWDHKMIIESLEILSSGFKDSKTSLSPRRTEPRVNEAEVVTGNQKLTLMFFLLHFSPFWYITFFKTLTGTFKCMSMDERRDEWRETRVRWRLFPWRCSWIFPGHHLMRLRIDPKFNLEMKR